MFSTKESILLSFDRIEKNDHLERIAFYEEHRKLIFSLEEEKQYYFAFHYIDSLFLSGKYALVLTEINPLIEFVFIYDINYLSKGTYEHLIYKKAQCHFEMLQYEDSIKVLEQLVGIHPDDQNYHRLLNKAYRASLNFNSASIRLTALILIFISAIICGILWFINHSGKESSLSDAFLIIMSPCFLAVGLLGGAHFINYLRSNQKTLRLIRTKRSQKH